MSDPPAPVDGGGGEPEQGGRNGWVIFGLVVGIIAATIIGTLIVSKLMNWVLDRLGVALTDEPRRSGGSSDAESERYSDGSE